MKQNKTVEAGERTHQHTPGPWVAVPDSTCTGAWFSIRPVGGGFDDEIARSETFALNNTGRSTTIVEHPEDFTVDSWGEHVRADARLIAAAPELLDSCKALLAMVQEHLPNNSTAVHEAIAAVSKAEGASAYHEERIRCPECMREQIATVEHTAPWWTFIHTCECGHTIMESEWNKVAQ